ncbi:MAG: hypothetical protein PVI88_00375 [Nitrosopumilaceae archaeon]|jgi:hypothetical protein
MKKQIIAAIKDISELGVDFDISLDEAEKYGEDVLIAELEEAAVILEDGDKLQKSTVDTFTELEIDIPAGIKIVPSKKPVTKKPVSNKKSKKQKKAPIKKSKKNEKPKSAKPKTDKKEIKKSQKNKYRKKSSDLSNELAKLLEEADYTQKEIREELFDRFDGKIPKKRISDLLSCVKNPKYNIFDNLVVIDDDGIMKFEK